jgi:hypothetical protein
MYKNLLYGILSLIIIHSKKNYIRINILKRILIVSIATAIKLFIPVMPEKIVLWFLNDCGLREKFNRIIIKGLKNRKEVK